MNTNKLICFDLDDTLIREYHSVMIPCILNGKEQEHSIIQAREESGELDYVSADNQRAKLLNGLELDKLHSGFLKLAKPLRNIEKTINSLHENNFKCILITVGPRQVAEVAKNLWGFDSCYGSDYEVRDGVFTGNILKFIDGEGKVDCLNEYCSVHNIEKLNCTAVGDGSTDIPLFKICGSSIALNGNQSARKSASIAIDSDDLSDILKFIL